MCNLIFGNRSTNYDSKQKNEASASEAVPRKSDEETLRETWSRIDIQYFSPGFTLRFFKHTLVFDLSIVMGFFKAQLQSTDLHEKCHLKWVVLIKEAACIC